MTWKVGDKVHLVKTVGGVPAGCAGRIERVFPEEAFPFTVQFANGARVNVKEYEIQGPEVPVFPPAKDFAAEDFVNHPKHYTKHPSGVECIQITEHMNFNLGNAFKYVWRAGEKGDAVADLRKARWYLAREIARLGGSADE